MKNPNSASKRLFARLRDRWSASDMPGLEPRFQVFSFLKDVFVFVAIPGMAVLIAKGGEDTGARSKGKARIEKRKPLDVKDQGSQLISFQGRTKGSNGYLPGQKGPGNLVRVRLLNRLEALSGMPVHAQIVDIGLGSPFIGGIMIGEGSGDQSFNRINIAFSFVRRAGGAGVGAPISAKAISLDGTLGLIASPKDGLLERGMSAGAANGVSGLGGSGGDLGLKSLLLQVLTAGLSQEVGKDIGVERNRGQALSLDPGVEFFAELTDFFPKEGK
jgi:hypothetical protein